MSFSHNQNINTMKRICLLLPALGLLLLSCNTHREPSETIIGKSDIVIENGIFTPEALWALGRLGEVAVSPSGMRVAYTVTYYSVDQNRSNTEIFVMNADGSACQQITKTAAHEFNIAWVDDNTIAYISKGLRGPERSGRPFRRYSQATGERLGQAGWPSPCEEERIVRSARLAGRIHQFLWRHSRAVSDASKELSDEGR